MKKKNQGAAYLIANFRSALLEAIVAAETDANVAALTSQVLIEHGPWLAGLCQHHKIAPEFVVGWDAFEKARQPKQDKHECGFGLFCNTWLRIGVYESRGALLPFPDPRKASHMAVLALENSLGPEWQESDQVASCFAIARHRYGESDGNTWAALNRSERREVVRQKLFATAKKISRRSSKFIELQG